MKRDTKLAQVLTHSVKVIPLNTWLPNTWKLQKHLISVSFLGRFFFVCLAGWLFGVFFFFWLFRAAPMAYGDSWAGGQIGATALGLRHSHSNAGSEVPL